MAASTDPSEQLPNLSTTEQPSGERAVSQEQKTLEWGPIEHLAHYSCDEHDRITFDLACLHAFKEPSLPANLTRGREKFYRKNRHNRTVGHPIPLDNLARACVALGKENELRSADIVTWRGVLVKLMLGVRIEIKFFDMDGTLYLLEYDFRPHALYGDQLKQGYHGYAFESLCTQEANSPATIPTLDVWKCIVRRSFGDLNIVFGAEVDCVEGQYEQRSDNLMELKTEIMHSARVDHKKKKKWYFQSSLIGIPEICIGYRDNDFILQKVDRVPLDRLYKPPSGMLEESYTFAHQILQSLRAFCSNSGHRQSNPVWRVVVQRGALLGQPEVVSLRHEGC